ncbi:MAG: hypothetical protein LBN38_03710 [Verrucomicrobiota bacterium]|jgi:flagellar motor protein MotB|nr:hypothetical protein [Verrucomicrobiota bacterium]
MDSRDDISDALQGGIGRRKGRIKGHVDAQLDLFTSLADRRSAGGPRAVAGPEADGLFIPGRPPPDDVAADVRAVLSNAPGEEDARLAFPPSGEGRPPLKTGIYRRPRPVASSIPSRPPPRKPVFARISLFHFLREHLEGMEMSRRLVAGVVGLILLVAAIAFWTASPAPAPIRRAAVPPPSPPVSSMQPAHAVPSIPPPSIVPDSSLPAWTLPGAVVTVGPNGYLVQFENPVFVSTTKISPEGMQALRSVAAKLLSFSRGGHVVVTGHTDDTPLSRPTPELRTNADLAAARAAVAAEHLKNFARGNRLLTFEEKAGLPVQAPYPNDTPRNRRLNRTVTLQILPEAP